MLRQEEEVGRDHGNHTTNQDEWKLSSGTEDYFLGTFYFDKGQYFLPLAGVTALCPAPNAGSTHRRRRILSDACTTSSPPPQLPRGGPAAPRCSGPMLHDTVVFTAERNG